jgi:zeaxanthin glucosyltransferase
MAHIGITCPPAHSHLSNMLTVGRALRQRGHRVTVFHISDMAHRVSGADLEFASVGSQAYPSGALAAQDSKVKSMGGLSALRFGVEQIARFASVICAEVPLKAQSIGVDAMVVDQDEPGGGSAAEALRIPFVSVANSLALNSDPSLPPVYTPWGYRDRAWARLRNQLCYFVARQVSRPIRNAINKHRKDLGLPKQRGIDDSLSRLAQLSQQPPAFDLPRRDLPKHFHYVGPLRNSAVCDVSFPWAALDGRPVVYASMGTLLSGRADVFQTIAQACQGLDVQLVISHVGCLNKDEVKTLSKWALVVDYAPQYELLARARLTITHGGLNTVLDSLSHGVPVVAIPCMNDAFGTGVRLEWTGAGRVVPWKRLTLPRLRSAVRDTLSNETYLHAARRIKQSIQQAGGLAKAVEIIEQAVTSRSPVLREAAPDTTARSDSDAKLCRNLASRSDA